MQVKTYGRKIAQRSIHLMHQQSGLKLSKNLLLANCMSAPWNPRAQNKYVSWQNMAAQSDTCCTGALERVIASHNCRLLPGKITKWCPSRLHNRQTPSSGVSTVDTCQNCLVCMPVIEENWWWTIATNPVSKVSDPLTLKRPKMWTVLWSSTDQVFPWRTRSKPCCSHDSQVFTKEGFQGSDILQGWVILANYRKVQLWHFGTSKGAVNVLIPVCCLKVVCWLYHNIFAHDIICFSSQTCAGCLGHDWRVTTPQKANIQH